MNADKIYFINDKFNQTSLTGDRVMVDFDAGKFFMVKGVGNVIWEKIGRGKTPKEIIAELINEYDVSEETCTKEVEAFIDKLIERGLIR